MLALQDKVAMITGAAGGIGAATARIMAHAGARLALADIRRDAAERVAQQIRAEGGKAIALELDLAHEHSILSAIGVTVQTYGHIDIDRKSVV